jgi:acetyltransferase-like isoleucine patch superfamily enzyme
VAAFVHPDADVHETATIGEGSRVWALAHVRERARIGKNVTVGRGALVDLDVTVGDNCKIQSNALLYMGSVLEDGVFIGPAVMLLNDRLPRAINPDGTLKSASDWTVSGVTVCYGAAIGGGAILTPGVKIGRWAIVGAGSVVTKDVPEHALVAGNPSRIVRYVDSAGEPRTSG